MMLWRVELCQEELFLLVLIPVSFFLYLRQLKGRECCSCGKKKQPKLLCSMVAGVQIYNCLGAMCQPYVLSSSYTDSSHCF